MENELPLFEVEQIIPCCPQPIKFQFIDAQTRQPFSTSFYKDMGQNVNKCCCGENYYIFPDMIHSKVINPNDFSVTKCYDTRSFYRTFEYMGGTYYKIGKPYVPVDGCCCKYCCSCCNAGVVKVRDDEPCCACCEKPPVPERRTYADIFNMSDQSVGKYVQYFNQSGCVCCQNSTIFFEVYFPSDANEMLKLALIGHFIFILLLGPIIFGYLPGSKDNLGMLIN